MSEASRVRTMALMVLGGMAGAGVALMMTPTTGRENREELGKVIERLRGQAAIHNRRVELRLFQAMDRISDLLIDIFGELEPFTEARQQQLLDLVAQEKRVIQALEAPTGDAS